MSKFIGRQVDLGVARESSRGTAVAPAFWVPKVGFSFDEKVETARIESGVGTLADSEQVHVLTKYAAGDVEAEVRSKSFGLFLYSLLGTISTAGPTDSSYTHSFSLEDTTQHESLTFTVVDPNTTEQYRLVVLDTLELTQEVDDVLRFTASFVGKTSTGASATPSYSTEYKFTKKHFSFKVAAAVGDLAAASAVSLKRFAVTFTNNVEMDNQLGTAEPEDIRNKQFSVEGSFDVDYEAETWKNYMRDNTYRAMEFKWTNTGETIGAGSTNPSLTFQMPRVDFYDWEPNYALDEINSQTMSFKGNHDLSGSNSIVSTCDLVNGQTSY